MFYLIGQIVKVRVWTYGVPASKNHPRFRTGFTVVPGVVERVPVRPGGSYLVRVASNHAVTAIPEELTPAFEIDPKVILNYLKMYRWPSEYQARQDAAKCARWDGQAAEDAPCPAPAEASPNPTPSDPLHPRAAVIPESERDLTRSPPERRRGRRGTTRP